MKSIRMRLVVFGAAAAVAGALGTTSVRAHHSQSQFEPEATISVEGTLTKGSWANPHTLFVLQGKKVGSSDAPQEWTVEGPSPRQLETKGWGRAVSKPGDKLTFEGRPRRDGQPELLLLSVTLADGKTISFKPE
jgi:ABC-type transport system substrate-binding protein